MVPVTKGVVFDVDGVLVDSYRAHFASWKRLGEETGVSLTEAEFAEDFGRTSREVILARFGAHLTEEEVRRLDHRKEALFRAIVEADFPAMDGARELIRELAADGMRLAVGSSAPPENVALVLERLGVGNLLHGVVTGSDVSRGKPDPEVFRRAGERLGLPPGRCVVVEDAVPGIEAARAAGMKAVALVSTGRDAATLRAARPDLVVRSLRELSPAILRQLGT